MRKVKTVAVTGTNGKTTTVVLARQLLESVGHRTASLGTLGLDIKDTVIYEPILIGCDAMFELAEELHHYYQVETLIYEAFSTAIMGRLYDKLPPDIAVLTYIGEDHIEYHGSKECYVNSKLRLFQEVLDGKGTAIYNIGDERAQELQHICEQRNIYPFTFSINQKSDLWLSDLKGDCFGTKGILNYQDKQYFVTLPFIGDIFLLDWLAALSISLQFSNNIEELLEMSKRLLLPPGRLEFIGSYNGAKIYVDYAHTPCALMALLKEVRKVTHGEMHLLFGCGGGRDVSKRSQMGKVAQRFADIIYITDDNPRDENPKKIRSQIKEFCPSGTEIGDRKLAIESAIQNLKTDDTLIIAGKGHENYQEVKGSKKYFSDKATVLNILDKVIAISHNKSEVAN